MGLLARDLVAVPESTRGMEIMRVLDGLEERMGWERWGKGEVGVGRSL